ncbi:nucleotidyltransferase family protein [Amaricoccus tamworthensis]|uniref:nucleotidyltransferase family protein n=1 Tax=Amaricoccus tamworthensis TaxID=57002 RepID=UPI003C7E6ACE
MTDDHLRYSGLSISRQTETLREILRASPRMMDVMERVRLLDLPDAWIVSGAIYNTVWNALTGRPDMHGVNDIDLFYFNHDTTWEAEDEVIRRVAEAIPGKPPVETRNQARVHLWYEQRFGRPGPKFSSSREALLYFAARTHSVAARLEHDGNIAVHAPFGLDNIFSFRLVPNTIRPNRETHEAKAARQMALWPELEFFPWPKHAMATLEDT